MSPCSREGPVYPVGRGSRSLWQSIHWPRVVSGPFRLLLKATLFWNVIEAKLFLYWSVLSFSCTLVRLLLQFSDKILSVRELRTDILGIFYPAMHLIHSLTYHPGTEWRTGSASGDHLVGAAVILTTHLLRGKQEKVGWQTLPSWLYLAVWSFTLLLMRNNFLCRI